MRDVATQLRIARAIHLAHAARADRLDDFIRPEPRAGRDRHRHPRGSIGLLFLPAGLYRTRVAKPEDRAVSSGAERRRAPALEGERPREPRCPGSTRRRLEESAVAFVDDHRARVVLVEQVVDARERRELPRADLGDVAAAELAMEYEAAESEFRSLTNTFVR